VLLACVSLAMCALVVYLTRQQSRATQLQLRLLEMEEKAKHDARRYYKRLFALSNVSEIMGAKNDVEDIFDRITSMCVEAFDADTASLMIFDQETQDLIVRSASAKDATPGFIGACQKIGTGIAGWAAKNRQSLLLNRGAELSQYEGLKWEDDSISASMVVPIIVRDELVGVINVTSQTPGIRYDSEDIQTLQVFALNAGACIRHTEQVQWLRQMSGVPQQTRIAQYSPTDR
jgi:GAF domain-containing protein